MNRRSVIAIGAIALLIVASAVWLSRGRMNEPAGSSAQVVDGVAQDSSGRKVLYWYDPMVPAQRFKQPGKSPFMDMQLVPKYADEAGDSGVRVSSTVQQNLAIRLATAEVMQLGESITAVGRIEADERRSYDLQSRVAGFVERLLVRAEGDPVSAGQKVAEIYSPESLSAQQEFLALLRLPNVPDQRSLVEASRERLHLLGMAEREIDAVAQSGNARTRFGLYSPASGFVSELNVRQGAQISPGTSLMRIADLSSLWLVAAIPERAAGKIKAGDPVTAQLESLPGESVQGKVEYVYPTLEAGTRSTRVRMSLPNKHGALRPGMFATATIDTPRREAIAVPTEAVIVTGERQLVIVKENDHFRPVEVRTGIEQSGRTEILEGLKPGDQVVASGQFLMDSEASLSGVLARLSAADASHAEHAQ